MPKGYENIFEDFAKGPVHLLVTGYEALLIGLAIVLYHNIWDGAWWVVLITIFVWLSLLKGVFRLLFPSMVMGWIKSMMKSKNMMTFSMVFTLVFGVIFSYYGFLV